MRTVWVFVCREFVVSVFFRVFVEFGWSGVYRVRYRVVIDEDCIVFERGFG